MKEKLSLKIVIAFVVMIITILYFSIPQIINLQKANGLTICTLEDYRNLFSIISPMLGSMIGIMGLVLGYFYYKEKIKNDEILSKMKRMGNNITTIYDNYGFINDGIQLILNKGIKTENDLKLTRNSIIRKFDDINLLLELNHEIIDLDQNETTELIRLYSYVEKNDLIMNVSLKVLKKSDLTEIIHNYNIKIRNSKKILLRKFS
jgi:hypothetical protein